MAAVGRMFAGLVLLAVALFIGSVMLVSCRLSARDWGPSEGVPVDKGQALADDLMYGASDAEIAAQVEQLNGTVLEVRRAPDTISVIASFSTDVDDPASPLECREIVLTPETSAYDEVDCPVR